MQGLSRHLILGEEHAHYTDNTPRERNRVLTEQEGANPQSHQTSCQYTAQNGPDAERLCQHTTALFCHLSNNACMEFVRQHTLLKTLQRSLPSNAFLTP